MSSLTEVVAAVIADGGHYLACRRLPERGGRWEFPGGKVEPGEDPRSALQREIFEELGVGIVVGDLVTQVDDLELGIRLVSYEATLTGGRPTSSTDHDRLEWLPVDRLSSLAFGNADRVTAEAVAASA